MNGISYEEQLLQLPASTPITLDWQSLALGPWLLDYVPNLGAPGLDFETWETAMP